MSKMFLCFITNRTKQQLLVFQSHSILTAHLLNAKKFQIDAVYLSSLILDTCLKWVNSEQAADPEEQQTANPQ